MSHRNASLTPTGRLRLARCIVENAWPLRRAADRFGVSGIAFIHNAIDDHSRLAYSEILAAERKETAAGFWTCAHAYFTSCGITVKRVLTDNGSAYR